MPHAAHANQQEVRWSLLNSVLFRFCFVYLFLSTWFWILEFGDKSTALLRRLYLAMLGPFVRWTAAHIFHWTSVAEPNFLRDTRYLYALLTFLLITSLGCTAVWSIVDRAKSNYQSMHQWLRIFLRYSLAYLMLHYALDKIFLLQFPAPTMARLVEPFGQYSPSSLMWAFIGTSKTFTIFGGLAEMTGALLLFFRRTSTLGALITFVVMLNVTVMDFSYDVSVKIFCLHLLVIAAFLFLPDTQRLLQFFVFNQPTQPAANSELVLRPKMHRLSLAFKVVVILCLVVPLTVRDFKSYRSGAAAASVLPIYGLYEVEDYALDGTPRPPLLSDAARWRYLMLDSPGTLTIKHMDDTIATYPMIYDVALHQIQLLDHEASAVDQKAATGAGLFTVTEYGYGRLVLTGSMHGSTLSIKLHRMNLSDFPLIGRGFHWVSESSYIR